MKIVIIGEGPSRTNDGSATGKQGPFDGPAGIRISSLMEVSLQEFLDAFDRRNLYSTHMRDEMWNKHDARIIAQSNESLALKTVILLGRKVQKAFFPDEAISFFEWIDHKGGKWVIAPHPSGRNRYWNDAESVNAAAEFWADVGRRAKLIV